MKEDHIRMDLLSQKYNKINQDYGMKREKYKIHLIF